MSEPTTGPLPGTSRTLHGWARTAPSAARVLAPTRAVEVTAALPEPSGGAVAGRGLLARGLGRSYGDAAQNAGGTVVDMPSLAGVLSVDAQAGVVEVEAGMSLDSLMRRVLPLGWFVPVTPGTRHVTVGGAIAADLHGKNHHVDGSFARHVLSLELLTADGRVRTVSPARDAELFWATAGGMGLTGVILSAQLALIRVETASVSVDTERAGDLDDLMDRLARTDDAYRYSVAWIDLLARGAQLGRAVLTRGDHAPLDALPAGRRADPLAFAPKPLATMPHGIPGGLLRRTTVAAFNELWFRRAPRERRGQLTGLGSFFHPLDGLLEWNRLYGPRGFLQYQFVVPYGAETALRAAVERISAARVPTFLAVLKRFGPAGPAPLSFPVPGWTLALDIPTGVPGLARLLDGLDQLVLEAGGRLYLAKDSRLDPRLLPRMYPRLEEWRATRRRVDPHGVFVSDLSRRLAL